MSVYQKFKTIARLQLFGDDDVWASNTNSTYKTPDSNFTNGKRMRFTFNTESLADLQRGIVGTGACCNNFRFHLHAAQAQGQGHHMLERATSGQIRLARGTSNTEGIGQN
jgi:hypothetical protein